MTLVSIFFFFWCKLVSNFDNLKNFTFCGTHGLTWCSFYFFFFSFNPQYKNSPNLVKKKKKPNPETQCEKERKEEKKKKITRIDPAWKGKKRKRRRRRTPAWKKKKKRRRIPDLTTYMLWVPQIYVYLPKCHHNSVSITQKHLKVVFSFHNLSLKNQKIE